MQISKENQLSSTGKNFDFCSFSNLNASSETTENKLKGNATTTKLEHETVFFEDGTIKREIFCSLKSKTERADQRNSVVKQYSKQKDDLYIVPNWPRKQKQTFDLKNSPKTARSSQRQRRFAKKRYYLDIDCSKKSVQNKFFKSKLTQKNSKQQYRPSELFLSPTSSDDPLDNAQSMEVMADPFDLEKQVKQHCKGRRSAQAKSIGRQIRDRSRSAKSCRSVAEKIQRSSRSPSRGMSSFKRALILKKQKLYKKAFLFFKKVKRGDHKYADSLFYQAFLLDKDGKYPEALAVYQEFLTLKPKNEFGLFNLGICFKNNREYEKSLHFFNKVLHIKTKLKMLIQRPFKFSQNILSFTITGRVF